MLQPKNQKFRKSFKPRMKGKSNSCNKVALGDYGLKSLERSWLSARQIEAVRKVIVRVTKRKGKYWSRVFPDRPITGKSGEVGMGKGKGDVDYFVAELKPGRVMFELGGVPRELAEEAFRKASAKLPVKTKFVSKGI